MRDPLDGEVDDREDSDEENSSVGIWLLIIGAILIFLKAMMTLYEVSNE